MYLQRLSTRYLERPRRGLPARQPVRSLWRLGASSRLLFAREGTHAELRRKSDLITVWRRPRGLSKCQVGQWQALGLAPATVPEGVRESPLRD